MKQHTLMMVLGLLWVLGAGAADSGDEAAQRTQIGQAREAAERRYLAEERGCYQRFAVTDCLEDAKRTRRKTLGELQRQEAALNQARRQREGAERRQLLAQRALAARQRAASAPPATVPQPGQPGAAEGDAPQDVRSVGTEVPLSKKGGTVGRSPAKASEAGQAQQRKLQEAEARRAALARRQAERRKPAAAPLPVPP